MKKTWLQSDRWTVGLILVAIVTGVVFFAGHEAFAIFFGVATLLVAWEGARMLTGENFLTCLAALVTLALLMVFSWNYDFLGEALIFFAVLWWLAMFFIVALYQPGFIRSSWFPWLFRLGLPFMLAAFWVAVVDLHRFSPAWFFYLLGLISLSDIFAYLAGRRWGQRRISPDISPGKTSEGLWGALLIGLLLSLVTGLFAYEGFDDTVFLVLLSLFLVIFGLIGDLTESMVKRYSGRKDSGTLLAGHGGVWDRLDSLIATAPIFLVFMPLMNIQGVGG